MRPHAYTWQQVCLLADKTVRVRKLDTRRLRALNRLSVLDQPDAWERILRRTQLSATHTLQRAAPVKQIGRI